MDQRVAKGYERTDYYTTIRWRDYHGSDHEREFKVFKNFYADSIHATLVLDPDDSDFAVIDNWRYSNPWIHLTKALLAAGGATLLLFLLVDSWSWS